MKNRKFDQLLKTLSYNPEAPEQEPYKPARLETQPPVDPVEASYDGMKLGEMPARTDSKHKDEEEELNDSMFKSPKTEDETAMSLDKLSKLLDKIRK